MARRKPLSFEQEVLLESAIGSHAEYKRAQVALKSEIKKELEARLTRFETERDAAVRRAMDAGISDNMLREQMSCDVNLIYRIKERTSGQSSQAAGVESASFGLAFSRITHEENGKSYEGLNVRIPQSPDVVQGELVPVIGTFWYDTEELEWTTRKANLDIASQPHIHDIRRQITNPNRPLAILLTAKMKESNA